MNLFRRIYLTLEPNNGSDAVPRLTHHYFFYAILGQLALTNDHPISYGFWIDYFIAFSSPSESFIFLRTLLERFQCR
jgi:hypothetical protein